MKKKICILALAAFTAVLLSACGNGEQDSRQVEVAGSGASTQTGRATLSVSPGSVSLCEKDAHIDATVTWQRIDTSIKNTKVTVNSPGSGEEKLFSEGGYEGSEKTGDWVVAGVSFRLYDADSGTPLASYTIGTTPCATTSE